MDNIDRKLLLIFDEVFRSGSISHAAERLALGQPAVSMGLRRLRAHFHDALFVRTPAGMAPTPLAQDLIPYVRETLDLLQATLNYRTRFDPAVEARTFRLCMNDVSQMVVLPALLRLVRQGAPAIQLEVTGITRDTPRMLEAGDIDLAIGFIPALQAGFYQQKLLDEVFVCIAWAQHPRLRGRLSLAQFQREPHLVVSTVGTGHNQIERVLAERGIRRRVAVRVPNFTGMAANLENTDHLALVPRRLGALLQAREQIKMYSLPFASPGYQVMQHWHERHAREPGHMWLRRAIAGLPAEPGLRSSGRAARAS